MSHCHSQNSVAHLLHSGPAAALTREKNSGVEIHHTLGPSDDGLTRSMVVKQLVARPTPSDITTAAVASRNASVACFRTSAKGVFPCLHELSK